MTKKKRAIITIGIGIGVFYCVALLYANREVFFGPREEWAPHTISAQEIQRARLGIVLFARKYQRNPQSIEELLKCLGWEIPDDGRYVLKDAWGQDIRYNPINPKINKDSFDLYSIGENGIDESDTPGFGDDIVCMSDGRVTFGPNRKKANASTP